MKKILMFTFAFILIISLSACKSDDQTIQADLENEETVKQNIKVEQLEDEIDDLNSIISNNKKQILDLETIIDMETEESIETINSNFREDGYQEITGIKSCENGILMLTPYENSINLGEIKHDEVKVITTGSNDDGESWALVEVLGRLVGNRYGYVKVESLSSGVTGKFEYDLLNIEESLQSISIGDNLEEIIDHFGRGYYVIKDSNAYQIGYKTDIEGEDIVFTIDSRVLKVRGIRTTSCEYKLDSGIGVGKPIKSVSGIYNEDNLLILDNHMIIDLGDGFIMFLQVNEDNLTDESIISRIDIEPDWNGMFK